MFLSIRFLRNKVYKDEKRQRTSTTQSFSICLPINMNNFTLLQDKYNKVNKPKSRGNKGNNSDKGDKGKGNKRN